MSSPTQEKLAQFSRVLVFPGLLEETPVVDQVLGILPWKVISGHQENVVGVSATGLGPAFWINPGSSTTDSSPNPGVPVSTFALKRLYRDVMLDSSLVDTMSTEVDIAQAQVDAALRTILYAVGSGLFYGRSGAIPSQFDGFNSLVLTSQTVGARNDDPDGGPATLSDYDRLLNKIVVANGRADAIVGNLRSLQKWKALHYASGVMPELGYLCVGHSPTDSVPRRLDGRCASRTPVFLHNGVPFLVSEHILSNEKKGAGTGLTSAWAVKLGDGVGLCLTTPERFGRSPFKVERFLNTFGDQERYRVVLNVGLTMFSPGALARLNGIDNQ